MLRTFQIPLVFPANSSQFMSMPMQYCVWVCHNCNSLFWYGVANFCLVMHFVLYFCVCQCNPVFECPISILWVCHCNSMFEYIIVILCLGIHF